MMKQILATVFIFSFFTTEVKSQSIDSFFKNTSSFLNTYVSNGKVDYAAIKNNPQQLDELVKLASTVLVTINEPKTYQAFWINAYNIMVIKGIVDNYPISSPLDKKGFFDTIKYNVAGENIALNHIENKKLRAQFNDARFHFVLVCGAKGCPPLITQAYTPKNLEELLEQQTIKALNNDAFIKVSKKKVAFSEIFKWYKEDFVTKTQNEIDFLNRYRKTKVSKNSKVAYYPYNWNLNSK